MNENDAYFDYGWRVSSSYHLLCDYDGLGLETDGCARHGETLSSNFVFYDFARGGGP